MTYDTAVRTSVVSELKELVHLRGSVPASFVRVVAEDLGCHPATVWRWLKEAVAASPDSFGERTSSKHIAELKPDHIEVVYSHNGNLRAAKRELDRIDPEIAAMSERTFRRRWEQVDPAVRAMATDGAEGLLASQLRMVYDASHRNHIWHIDSMEIPVWVVPEGHETTMVKPWLITVEDDHTRRIMAVLLTVERPNADDVVVALADAMRMRKLSDGTDVGGVPEILHSDNGAEFKNNLVSIGLARLGITRKLSYPYRKHLNGKVERLQGITQEEFLSNLPGFVDGPRSLSRKDFFGVDSAVLTEEVLFMLLENWVEEYNSTRPHSALGGRTPNQVWAEQQNPLRQVAPEMLRLSLMASKRSYKVHPRGIHFQKQYYTAPELASLVGSLVDVRYLPRDDSFIEVFVGDKWVCTAFLHPDLTDTQRAEIRARNQEQYTKARTYLLAAKERRLKAAQAGSGVLLTQPAGPPVSELAADADAFLALAESEEE